MALSDPDEVQKRDDDAPEPFIRMWTVYKNPLDYPEQFVARLYKDEKATGTIVISSNYSTIEAQMLLLGLYRLPRRAEDDACIMEIWL